MTIFWDWNGTLLADVPLVVKVNNLVFAAKGYRAISEAEYRRIFRFPIRDYYRDLGVGDMAFDQIAQAWTDGYVEHFGECGLRPDAAQTVRRFHQAGWRQVIISASRQDLLRGQVARFPALDGMFEDILGLADVYAVSKVQLARDYLARSGVRPEEAVFLGDTTHDAEVAAAIGCRCLLIAGGHQADEVLAASGAAVLPSLSAASEALGLEGRGKARCAKA